MRLYELCPSLRDQPRLRLCDTPSLIRPLTHLSAQLTRSSSALYTPHVYLKDDGELHRLYAGNKVRKLEWILGDAIARGARSVWTAGGLGSHHALATALHAEALGLECHIFQVDQPLTDHAQATLNALMSTSARLTLMTPPLSGERAPSSFKRQLHAWLGRDPAIPYDHHDQTYYIASGGSTLLGTLGYVEAGLELAHQLERSEDAALSQLDAIYLALGSGSTASGLTLGLRLAGLSAAVIAVAVAPRYLVNLKVVTRQIERCLDLLKSYGLSDRAVRNLKACRHTSSEWGVSVTRDYLGVGYGHPSAAGCAAATLAQEDDLYLDPIYTAKAMGALLDHESHRDHQARRSVLFWSTLSR